MSATDDLEGLIDEAVRLFHGGDRDMMTLPEINRVYALCRSLVRVGATPTLLHRARQVAWSRYTVPVTLKLCFDHWSELLAEPPTRQPARWVRRAPEPAPTPEQVERVRRHLRIVREAG